MHHGRASLFVVSVFALSQTALASDLNPSDDPIADAALDTMFQPGLGTPLDAGGPAIAPGVFQDAPDEPLPGRPLPERFGSAGTQRVIVHGGGAFHVNGSSNKFVIGGVGWETFFAENLSWNLELNGLWVKQDGDDAWGANANLLFRWHFLDYGSWTLYADGGAGVVVFTEEVPRFGSNFNFTPQLGLGATFDLDDSDARLVVGVRWHHISNASLHSDNPGRDSVMIYGGVSFPF